MTTVDLRGVACPSNYVRARMALEPLEPGAEIEFLLDEGEPVRNVPRSLRDDGDQVLALSAEEDYYRIRVRRREAPDGW